MVMVLMMMSAVADRISELLDCRLESLFGSLGSVILDRYGLVLEGDIKSLYTFFESDVLFNLLYAVRTVEMDIENDFLDLALLLGGLPVSEDRQFCSVGSSGYS